MLTEKNKEQTVFEFYSLCCKLKTVIRKGWLNWNVNKDRLESIAEHIFGVQMLAIAMQSQYEEYKDVDIKKVILMLAIHELGEIVIGDLTQWEIDATVKAEKEIAGVCEVLKDLLNKEQIVSLFIEFEKRESKEANFAYQCDKLEGGLQCKLYDTDNAVDLNNQEDNISCKDPIYVKNKEIEKSWSGMWLQFGMEKYGFDKNFYEVSKYTKNIDIEEIVKFLK